MNPDFLVIGAGVAGMRAAIELAEAGQVLVVAKDSLRESSSEYAQGGIAVALSDEDEVSLHEQDTLNAGDGLCHRAAVHALVEEGPAAIQELIDWGAAFDRTASGLAFTREGAHSRNRVLHAHGDSTGREIAHTLYRKAASLPNVTFRSYAATIDLLLDDGVCGASVWDDKSQSLIAVYPTGLLSPNDLWVTNLLKRMRRDELEGLPTHMALMGAGGVWPSESMNVAETYLRRGEIDKTVELLIATLNHTYTTYAFKEEIKVDKTLPTACNHGMPVAGDITSGEVENRHGTGDMPEAWGPANLILLLRDMLIYEDRESIHLLAGIPADWIQPGGHIAIASAPTTLGGKVSFKLDYPQQGRMHLHLDPAINLPEAIVRFPLAAGVSLRSVTLNGQPVAIQDGNSVTLKNLTGPVDLEAAF